MFLNNILRYQYGGGGGGTSNTTSGGGNTQNTTSGLSAETQGDKIGQVDTLVLPREVSSQTIDRKFGRADDFIELHIYNSNGQIIHSEENFSEYSLSLDIGATTTSNIQVDPEKILSNRGFITGNFTIKLNILKNKIFNTAEFPFILKETSTVNNDQLEKDLISALNQAMKKHSYNSK